jgi:phage head maturation protease
VKLIGQLVVFNTPRTIAGVPAVETISPAIRMVTSEAMPLRCLWRHDHARILAATDRGLEVFHSRQGIYVIASITAPPPEMLAALHAGALAGSCGWRHSDGSAAVWRVDAQPWRREVTEAVLVEVTLTTQPAYSDTWVRQLVPALESKWRACLRHPVTMPLATPVADLTITLPSQFFLADVIQKIYSARGIDYIAFTEHRVVKTAVAANPTARAICVRYARSLTSAKAVARRRALSFDNPKPETRQHAQQR